MHHLLIATVLAQPALAQSQGDWSLGLANAGPKSNNGPLAKGTVPARIGDSARPTITVEYFIGDSLGIQLLAATPFGHKIRADGTGIGTVKHLMPVLSSRDPFDAMLQLLPFVGIGVHFTGFFDDSPKGPLADLDLHLGNHWGMAAHLGTHDWLCPRTTLRAGLRWIQMRLDGARIGKVQIDPMIGGIRDLGKFQPIRAFTTARLGAFRRSAPLWQAGCDGRSGRCQGNVAHHCPSWASAPSRNACSPVSCSRQAPAAGPAAVPP